MNKRRRYKAKRRRAARRVVQPIALKVPEWLAAAAMRRLREDCDRLLGMHRWAERPYEPRQGHGAVVVPVNRAGLLAVDPASGVSIRFVKAWGKT